MSIQLLMPVKRSSKRARDGEGSGGVAWPLVLVVGTYDQASKEKHR